MFKNKKGNSAENQQTAVLSQELQAEEYALPSTLAQHSFTRHSAGATQHPRTGVQTALPEPCLSPAHSLGLSCRPHVSERLRSGLWYEDSHPGPEQNAAWDSAQKCKPFHPVSFVFVIATRGSREQVDLCRMESG